MFVAARRNAMDSQQFVNLIRSHPSNASRRGLLAGVTGGLLTVFPLGLTASAAKKRRSKRRKRKQRGNQTAQTPPSVAPPPPPPSSPPTPVNVVCPGPSDATLTGSRRFAQTFFAPISGPLTSAQCEVTTLNGEEEFTLEVRTIDSAGQPTAEILAATVVADVPATPDAQTLTLVGNFSVPALLQANQGYALVVTVGAGQGFRLQALDGSDTCPGELFFDSLADGTFLRLGRDMIFSATIGS
jgi:hypothetical protein